MRYDVPRWLRKLARALDHASSDAQAPLGDIAWLAARCRDTLRMNDELRALSLEDLVQSLAGSLREYPTDIPEPLLRAATAAPGDALAFALLRVEALALGLPGAPRWSSVKLTGSLERFPTAPAHLTLDDFVAASAFTERFAQLMSLGYPWINLSAAGVLRGALLVMVETPTYTQSDVAYTSVNASGPPTLVQRRAGWRIDDLVLIDD